MKLVPKYCQPVSFRRRRSLHQVLFTTSAASLVGLLSLGAGCSSGNSNGGSGGAPGGGGTSGGIACTVDKKVGQFALQLVPEVAANPATGVTGVPAFSQVNGGVKDGVYPSDVWVELVKDGNCRVMVGPTSACSPACSGTTVCRAGACVPAPVPKSVGTVTLMGLTEPLTITPNITNKSYYGSLTAAYPPYTIGSVVTMQAEGADYPGFSLKANGVQPLTAPAGQVLELATSKANQPLTVRWDTASGAGAGLVTLSLDIAHHGNVAAEVQCDVPDTGSVTIPGGLLDSLVSRGTAGFPHVAISRLSTDTTTIAPGCVTFSVATSLSIPLTVEGIKSCTLDEECTPPQVCKFPDLKCE